MEKGILRELGRRMQRIYLNGEDPSQLPSGVRHVPTTGTWSLSATRSGYSVRPQWRKKHKHCALRKKLRKNVLTITAKIDRFGATYQNENREDGLKENALWRIEVIPAHRANGGGR